MHSKQWNHLIGPTKGLRYYSKVGLSFESFPRKVQRTKKELPKPKQKAGPKLAKKTQISQEDQDETDSEQTTLIEEVAIPIDEESAN